MHASIIVSRGLLDRRPFIQPFVRLQLIRKLHDQNAVLTDKPDQSYQAHLRVNIYRGGTQC